MRRSFLTVICVMFVTVMSLTASSSAPAPGTVVFDSIPYPTPGNVVSQGYQCCGTAEIGDEIRLETDTPRRSGYVTVLMSSWSLNSSYPTMPSAGYTHPITLNIYLDDASAQAHQPVKTVTQSFVIPWRPEADPEKCGGGTAWFSAADNTCYNGYAFPIVFDLRSLNYDLPDQFIYGVAFNTNTWGYAPLNAPGPYESLNVGLNSTSGPTVGTDVNSDVVYWNTAHGSWYTGGGQGGIFRQDTGWTPYKPAVQFTTFAVPTTTASCKYGAWQNLVRADFSAFENQGQCVSYVQTGK